ncbi:MAG: dipeptide ABC transporter ATP-binding protein [Candidatus Humimicrobiaceae bacterium]|jgi:oligopeptide/dipeptide ABC transporter ATP-binding protein|nr:dipeptide ABC transporter ATP-binding protein [Candidatus Humimicrobiaceae bacterium]
MKNDVLLEVRNLKKYYSLRSGFLFQKTAGIVKAVDDISFYIRKGETMGLVGESGCGKSTTVRVILRLTPPTGGLVLYDGKNIFDLDKNEMFKVRREMQIIFQDPYASLSPRMTIGDIISEPMEIHRAGDRNSRMKRVKELLEIVGLNPEHINRYPHEFSGGQRQRVGVARALALTPKLLLCDEPVSALDVSVQAQILNLLSDLQKEFDLTYLFIAHDLSVVKHVSDKIGVMYLGKLVELAESEELYKNPLHPYTMGLLSAIPIPDPKIEKKRKRVVLEGDVPSPINPPSGCRFHPRCPNAQDICSMQEPELKNYSDEKNKNSGDGHFAACFFAGKPI